MDTTNDYGLGHALERHTEQEESGYLKIDWKIDKNLA
jgi:hypothetical protein